MDCLLPKGQTFSVFSVKFPCNWGPLFGGITALSWRRHYSFFSHTVSPPLWWTVGLDSHLFMSSNFAWSIASQSVSMLHFIVRLTYCFELGLMWGARTHTRSLSWPGFKLRVSQLQAQRSATELSSCPREVATNLRGAIIVCRRQHGTSMPAIHCSIIHANSLQETEQLYQECITTITYYPHVSTNCYDIIHYPDGWTWRSQWHLIH